MNTAKVELVACLAYRGMCALMQKTCTAVERVEGDLYRVTTEVVLEELTAEERVQYAKELAEPNPYEGMDWGGPPAPLFATVENALTYAQACQAYEDCIADLRAFGAPSECYSVTRSYEAELDNAASLAVNYTEGM